MIAGNSLMDRNAPPGLLAPAASGHRRQPAISSGAGTAPGGNAMP